MPEDTDTCEACHGFGFHFIATATTSGLVNRELQRCDSCDKFEGDQQAAHASGCGYQYTGGQGWMGFGPDKFILREVSDDTPVAQQNQVVWQAISSQRPVRDDFVVPAPDRDRVDVDEAIGRITVVFPVDSSIVLGNTQHRSFLFVEPVADAEDSIAGVQFSLAAADTEAWFDLDLGAAEAFFRAGLKLTTAIMRGDHGQATLVPKV